MSKQPAIRIGLGQFDPVFGQVRQNLDTMADMLAGSRTDLVVFPELCTTGYQFLSTAEVRRLSEDVPGGLSTQRCLQLAREHGTYIVFGMAERAGNTLYNSAVLVGPDGLCVRYRKAHLFQEEKRWFTPGNLAFAVQDIGICRVGMLICFDWIFPEAWRALALAGADVICHPSNLVLPGLAQAATVTRAVENRVFVALANRTGREARGRKAPLRFTGRSQLVSPAGRLLGTCGPRAQQLLEVRIQPAQARDKKITAANDLVEDRREDLYGARVRRSR